MSEAILGWALLLWVVYVLFYTSRWLHPYYDAIRSFGSGWLIAFVFAEILPFLFGEASHVVDWRFLVSIFLVGFLSYHLLEKHSYQHARGPRRKKEVTYLHVFGFWADNFIKGLLLVIFLNFYPADPSPLLFIGALSVSIVSNALNFRHFNEHHFRMPAALVGFVSLAFLIGVALAFLVAPHTPYLYLVLSFITGSITYFVIRDEIPRGKEGKPLFFMLGILIVIFFLLFLK
ncbi:MAG TPA: hypothetical protein VJH24_00190 [Candidatus Bilamarchaeaceae archaeon]|nr:hypothetical protein [Candidatus Bilamarchaeaceae archaeon]